MNNRLREEDVGEIRDADATNIRSVERSVLTPPHSSPFPSPSMLISSRITYVGLS